MPKKNPAVRASLAVTFKPGSKELGVTAKGTAAVVLALALGVGLLAWAITLLVKVVN